MLSSIEDNKGLGFNEVSKSHLLSTVAWTKFLAIVGYISVGFMLIAAIGVMFAGSMMSSLNSGFSSQFPFSSTGGMLSVLGGIGMGIFFLVILAFYFYPVYALMKFSTNIKKGIQEEDQQYLNEGFRYQKALFRYLGIITIIMLCFYLLIFVFGGLAALIGLSTM